MTGVLKVRRERREGLRDREVDVCFAKKPTKLDGTRVEDRVEQREMFVDEAARARSNELN